MKAFKMSNEHSPVKNIFTFYYYNGRENCLQVTRMIKKEWRIYNSCSKETVRVHHTIRCHCYFYLQFPNQDGAALCSGPVCTVRKTTVLFRLLCQQLLASTCHPLYSVLCEGNVSLQIAIRQRKCAITLPVCAHVSPRFKQKFQEIIHLKMNNLEVK